MPVDSNHSTPAPIDLAKFTDVVRLDNGRTLTIRFAEVADADALQSYFRGLSLETRYNRLMGGASELPPSELDKAVHVGVHHLFALVAELQVRDVSAIVGEVRYAFHPKSLTVEYGISVGDGFHGQGIASAMLANLECRVAALGAGVLFGETLRNNAPMIALARKRGYEFRTSPNDWKQVRFEKVISIARDNIRCESWRIAAMNGMPQEWLAASA